MTYFQVDLKRPIPSIDEVSAGYMWMAHIQYKLRYGKVLKILGVDTLAVGDAPIYDSMFVDVWFGVAECR